MVIWALGLLAALAASLTMATRTAALITANQVENAQAEALADAGVQLAMLDLGRTFAGILAVPPLAIDGTPRLCSLSGLGRLSIAVESETGKVDLNTATDALLLRLIEGVGSRDIAASSVADRILDFRDADNLHRLNGAEADTYRRANSASVPKNAPFVAVEELGEVLGLSPALVAKLHPYVTVYSSSTGVDPRMAPIRLLGVLAGQSAAGQSGSSRLRPAFTSRDAATAALPQGFLAAAAPHAFLIRSQAETAAGARFVREAIVDVQDRTAQRIAILRWYRGGSSGAELVQPAKTAPALPPC